MKWLRRRRKETATTAMMKMERARNLLFLSTLPEKVDYIFQNIAEIRSMLKQIMGILNGRIK